MKVDRQIEHWAHMLDESFRKTSLPKDESTKFKFGEVFTDDLDSDKDIEKRFTEIWPGWYQYFLSRVAKEKDLELEGQRQDVDDWDVWRIPVSECYGSVQKMIELMFDDLYGRWDDSKVTTLKDIVDAEIDRLIENASDNITVEELEDRGICIHKGCKHWGGYYPG